MYNKIKNIANQNGMLIALEGADGVGKTSLAKMIVEDLQKNDIDAEYIRNPGSDEVTEKIRNITKQYKMGWFSAACLFGAALKYSLDYNIVPKLDKHKVIIIDRFVRSTYIYQMFNKQFSNEGSMEFFKRISFFKDLTDQLLKGLWDIRPCFEFVLLCDPYIAWNRIHDRETSEAIDIWESQGRDYFNAIHESYEESSKKGLPYLGMNEPHVLTTTNTEPEVELGDLYYELDKIFKR